MYIREKYNLYQLAYHLVSKENYQLLYINNQTDEIWLEKQNRKVSTVIRFVHRGFDWKNHLKTDIAKVFQRVTTMKHIFTGKKIDVFNVYITKHEPVDEWETLKKSMILKEKKFVRMNVFYLSEEHFKDEHSRFFQKMAIKEPKSEVMPNKLTCENTIIQHQNHFHHLLENKMKNVRQVFSYGKPRFVYLLMILNLCMFIWLEWSGGSTNTQNLIQKGAISNPAILDGEWWRLISSMFLHVGWLHLAVNMLALYYLGIIIEKIFGPTRFLIIYFLAGIGGSLASFVFNQHISAGASSALFGLFGALLYFGFIYRTAYTQAMGKNIVIVLLINLMIGLLVLQIDMGAHLGGLFFGFLAAIITSLPNQKSILLQSLGVVCYFIFFVILITQGI